MYNKVILVGNLTRDVELRYLPNGSALAKLGLATNRKFKRQDGAMGEEVCFIDVNLFGRTAEVANQYLKKGSKILIEGRLVLESWVDQNGQKRSRHTVTADSMQMIDTRNSAANANAYDSEGGYGDSGYSNSGYSQPQQNNYAPPSNYPPQQNNSYNAMPQQNNYAPQNSYTQQQNSYGNHQATQQKFSQEDNYNNKIPEIDVDDDDIPF